MEKTRAGQLGLVAACFLISGFAALLYETIWLRQFAILLGTSEQALAVVLASYMGGLAIGSLVASRVVDAVRRPLLTYGVLELGIASAALLVPIGLAMAGSLQTAVFGGKAEPPEAGGLGYVVFCFAAAGGLILIPTGLMGATLPLLARHVVSRDEDLGPRVGMLYAINTAGAVTGTMFAAFVCLPALGLGRTAWVGVGANVLVFLIVLVMVRLQPDFRDPIERGEAAEKSTAPRAEPTRRKPKNNRRGESGSSPDPDLDGSRYRWILVFAAVSGAVSFCYEIIFTRMLSQILGGSVYAFATMLAGFLLGIALGGAIASRLARRRRASVIWFVYAQAAAAICTLATYGLVDRMAAWSWQDLGGQQTTVVQVLASIVALLPTSTCIGATFPLAIRIYARDQSEAAWGSARVYFWNVAGGIVGAIATGMLILPLLQYHGAATLAIVLNILIALSVVMVLRLTSLHLVAPAIALLLLLGNLPSPPENVLRVSALTGELTEGQIVFNHVGKSATVTVLEADGLMIFQTNGLPESSLLPRGSGRLHEHSAYWLSALPLMVRPECESMLIVGLGGGVTAERVPPSVDHVDILELEPAVVEANRAVADWRNDDPLANPKIRIILNDGRNALALTDKKYDVIVSQPSHPWTAGASHLYSREFDQLVRDHLNPGGIFLQWMNTEFVDEALVRSMGATLLDVFPHARVYQPTRGVLMFVASDTPLRPEAMAAADDKLTAADSDRELFQRLGVVSPTHLLLRLALDEATLRELSRGADLITDERNLLAMRAAIVRGTVSKEGVEELLDNHGPLSRGIDVASKLCPSLDLPVYLSGKIQLDNQDWVRQRLPLLRDPVDRAKVEARMLRVAGENRKWMERLRALATQYPGDSDVAFQLLSNRLLGQVTLSPHEESVAGDALSSQHRMVIDLLAALVDGDLQAARGRDVELAGWSVDDVAYEMSVRLRLPWRLEAPPPQRVERCNDAIRIIDRSAAFANLSGLAFFRVSAAVKAGRPEVALATAGSLARTINDKSVDKPDPGVVAAGVSNLMRCYGILRDPSLFRAVPQQRYRRVLTAVEMALSTASSF